MKEFPGLFDQLAAEDSGDRATQRKAIALANKRAKVRFAKFLKAAASKDEFQNRFNLIEDDFDLTIRTACAECGCELEADAIKESVRKTLEPVHTAVEKEAVRRPKMCPYHKEVTDISLAAGDPTAGFNAMSQHAWGAKHCQGEFEGGCNFKPDMVTQTYWDNKAEQAEQRRQERQQQQELTLNTLDFNDEVTQDAFTDELGEAGVFDEPDEPIADEPSAVGEGVGELEPMAASTKEAEALKTVDVTQGGDGPSPKMDKKKWTVDNVTPLETEGEGSPHPTKRVDILEPISTDRSDDFLEGTKAVTEHQDVEKKAPTQKGQGGSWSTNKGVNPVSKTARGDTPYFHAGLLEPLAIIESKFPGVTFNGEPFWSETPTQQTAFQHPLANQQVPGVVGHTDPSLDPILRQIGESDGGFPWKKAIKQALEAEGRWPGGGGPPQGPQPVARTARGDTPFFHAGLMDALGLIEKRFPGVTFNGEPLWSEAPTKQTVFQHPFAGQRIPGVVGHTDPTLDPVLREIGETDGGGNWKQKVQQAIDAPAPDQSVEQQAMQNLEQRTGLPHGQGRPAKVAWDPNAPRDYNLDNPSEYDQWRGDQMDEEYGANRPPSPPCENCGRDDESAIPTSAGNLCQECAAQLGASSLNSGDPFGIPHHRGAQDVEKNPLKELIDNGFEGFVPQGQAEQAIEDYNG